MDSLDSNKKTIDSISKTTQTECLKIFMSQFDSVDMSKWGINDKKYIDSVEAKKKADSTKEA